MFALLSHTMYNTECLNTTFFDDMIWKNELSKLNSYYIKCSDEMGNFLCSNTRNKFKEWHLENLIRQIPLGKLIRLIYLQHAIWIKWRAVNVHFRIYHTHYDLERYLRDVSNYMTILWHYYFLQKSILNLSICYLSWLENHLRDVLRTRMQIQARISHHNRMLIH